MALTGASAKATEPVRLPSVEDAPIALLADLSSGQILYAREADRRFAPASITKVMTTFLAFEKLQRGELDLRQRFTMGPEAAQEWRRKGSTMFLDGGDVATVEQLIRGITTVSANDGSIVLAEGSAGSVQAWVKQMNTTARAIGMRDSHFGTPNGWPDEGRTFTTARDLVTLAEAMIARHPSRYRRFVGQREMTFKDITQENHDPISGRVFGADGIKTGFTNQAGYGFLGSAVRGGRRVALVVGASPSSSARNRATLELLDWAYGAWEDRLLFARDAHVASALVQGGAKGKVQLRAPYAIFATFPRGQRQDITLTLHYRGPVAAPVRKGDQIAELVIRVGDQQPHTVPLVAASNVPIATGWRRLANGLGGLLR